MLQKIRFPGTKKPGLNKVSVPVIAFIFPAVVGPNNFRIRFKLLERHVVIIIKVIH